MDNALIDDRRIHVDFSQSVSKLWNQFRRKNVQGKGCFKCGSLDHIAKDCGDGSTIQHQNYILKDDNKQRGGNKNSDYEMVFDEGGSPRQEKVHRDLESDGKVQNLRGIELWMANTEIMGTETRVTGKGNGIKTTKLGMMARGMTGITEM